MESVKKEEEKRLKKRGENREGKKERGKKRGEKREGKTERGKKRGEKERAKIVEVGAETLLANYFCNCFSSSP